MLWNGVWPSLVAAWNGSLNTFTLSFYIVTYVLLTDSLVDRFFSAMMLSSLHQSVICVFRLKEPSFHSLGCCAIKRVFFIQKQKASSVSLKVAPFKTFYFFIISECFWKNKKGHMGRE